MIKTLKKSNTTTQFTINDIVKIIGIFDEHDVVKIVDEDACVLGKGVVNHASGALHDFFVRKQTIDRSIVVVNVDEYVCSKEVPLWVGV